MNYTDENVPVNCPECNEICEGFKAIYHHVLTNHKEYTIVEAGEAVRNWMEDAYVNLENLDAEYGIREKVDRDIDCKREGL